MHILAIFLLLVLALFTSFEVSAQPYKTLVTSINKDSKTPLYSIELQGQYVIDINAPFLWYTCQGQWFIYPMGCSSLECINGRTNLFCPSDNIYSDGQCLCTVTPVNPVTSSCSSAQLTYKSIIVAWTAGRNPTVSINFNNIYVSCAPTSLLQSLPEGSSGVAGLSWNPLSLAMQFTYPHLELTHMFAMCLPSTSGANGVIFFGQGPYFLHQVEVSSVLAYTPLLRLNNSEEYFIGVSGISINGEKIKFQSSTFEFDQLGNGGVQISTIVPYTTLRSDIYKEFLKEFSKATKGIPRAQKVVHPFDLCLVTSENGWRHVGLSVPEIDLELGDGAIWRIYGANSLKQVEDDVACLAFIDGGKSAKRAAVIGSYQMENNLLQFDLAASRLGFSSSLLFYNITCSNFNFTTI
ncbi:basic 7S globulin 2 precursor small subunit, putative [Ricinus communis]|uniref:Basic 7S globulin 2 small subunit, putative n=1 Tax=Ricinus communis TaxID=3988 RepID=B9SUN0_RICCO|nr:basic 7S globulin 2 precursor small subunit, putative [Ricinus communis]|eukprot:XP_002529699.1 basic 7S globulin [Ricinus communis]